jgi:hypothetical protein
MTLRYVYGIVPALAAGDVDGAAIEGIDGGRVRTIVEGPFAAAASEVSEAEYGSDSLNERVADLEWLTPRAAAHQAVNMRLLNVAGTVLPLSFGALYLDEDRVRDMLREDVASRSGRMQELGGRAEWVVTVSREVTTVPAADDDLRTLDEEIAKATPGKAFLLERRRASVATAAGERADADAARRALDVLTPVSERTYREPVARGGTDVVALRVSLLAPRERAGIVDAAIGSLRDELTSAGYHVRATGPWPAYRFGSLP